MDQIKFFIFVFELVLSLVVLFGLYFGITLMFKNKMFKVENYRMKMGGLWFYHPETSEWSRLTEDMVYTLLREYTPNGSAFLLKEEFYENWLCELDSDTPFKKGDKVIYLLSGKYHIEVLITKVSLMKGKVYYDLKILDEGEGALVHLMVDEKYLRHDI